MSEASLNRHKAVTKRQPATDLPNLAIAYVVGILLKEHADRYSGEIYRQKLGEGDDPDVIAKRLTLSIWRSNTGGCVRWLQSSADLSRHRGGVVGRRHKRRTLPTARIPQLCRDESPRVQGTINIAGHPNEYGTRRILTTN